MIEKAETETNANLAMSRRILSYAKIMKIKRKTIKSA